jgi:lactoylglutathione lyase
MNQPSASVTEQVAIKAPAERVFDALTEPQQRVKWWGAEGRFQTQRMEFDLRPGGRWLMSGIGMGGRPFTIRGVYREIERPRLLSFTWIPSWQGSDLETLVRFDLNEKDGVTTVRHTLQLDPGQPRPAPRVARRPSLAAEACGETCHLTKVGAGTPWRDQPPSRYSPPAPTFSTSARQMKYLHTMVRITDVDASLRFYTEALGLKEVKRQDVPQGRFTLIFLAAPGDESAQIELTHNWDPESYAGGRNFGHVAYGVDDIYATCKRLMDHGVTINRPPRDGRMAFIRSPDNISVELLQNGAALAPAEPWKSMPNVGVW